MRLRVGFGHQLSYGSNDYRQGDEFDVPDAVAINFLRSGLVLPADGVWPAGFQSASERTPDIQHSAAHEPCEPGPRPKGARAAMQVCTVSGCPCFTWKGKCRAHARSNTAGSRYHDSYRSDRRKRWDGLSRGYRQMHPYCESEKCSAIPAPLRPAATEVDHIDGLGLQGPRWDSPDNWQALCQRCHSAKTAGESFGR
jgi:5-methylcytosine-specific restriction protein A